MDTSYRERILPDRLTVSLTRTDVAENVWTARVVEVPAAVATGYGVHGACSAIAEALGDVLMEKMVL